MRTLPTCALGVIGALVAASPLLARHDRSAGASKAAV
jgi:hypothetical protein